MPRNSVSSFKLLYKPKVLPKLKLFGFSFFVCLFWFVVVLFALSKATKYNPFHNLDSWKVSGTTCPKFLPFHLILLQNIHEFNYESLNLLFHMLFR